MFTSLITRWWMSSKAGIVTCTSAVPARCSRAVSCDGQVPAPHQGPDHRSADAQMTSAERHGHQTDQSSLVWATIPGSVRSPARWWVWISSRPVKVLKDLRSLKATTGTMSSSLVSTSCDVFVPTGSFTASSMVPLCAGCVFSFGAASFGKAFTDSHLCAKRRESL